MRNCSGLLFYIIDEFTEEFLEAMSEAKVEVTPSTADNDVPETAAKLKNRRAGFKSVLTRKRNEVRSLLLDNINLELVKRISRDMKDASRKFEASHHQYVDVLLIQEEIAEAECYYVAELDMQENIAERILKWIETAELQKAYDSIEDSASNTGAASIRTRASSSSATRMKHLEAIANRRALEAKFM
jgi:hypothetical protein